VVHEGQGLPLGLEPGHHLPGVHSRLEHLQRDLPTDRLRLLGHEDDAEPALADLLQQLVRTDDCAGNFGGPRVAARPNLPGRRRLQEAGGPFVDGEQFFDPRAEGGVRLAGARQVGLAFVHFVPLQGGDEDVALGHDRPSGASTRQCAVGSPVAQRA
jgi:hypothetical protein